MKFVFLRWLDSQTPNAVGWINKSQIDMKPSKIETVGFVVKETKSSITVAGQVSVDDHDDVGGVITIPKVCITHRKEFAV